MFYNETTCNSFISFKDYNKNGNFTFSFFYLVYKLEQLNMIEVNFSNPPYSRRVTMFEI